MRKLALPLVIAGLLLGGCGPSSNNAAQTQRAPMPAAVTGTVTLADPSRWHPMRSSISP